MELTAVDSWIVVGGRTVGESGRTVGDRLLASAQYLLARKHTCSTATYDETILDIFMYFFDIIINDEADGPSHINKK